MFYQNRSNQFLIFTFKLIGIIFSGVVPPLTNPTAEKYCCTLSINCLFVSKKTCVLLIMNY